jgi:hypothetical protein
MQAGELRLRGRGQGLAVGYGVETTLGEGIAAADAAEGHNASADDSEAQHGDVGVLGTGREIDTAGDAEAVQDGRDDVAVEGEDGAEEQVFHWRPTLPVWCWAWRVWLRP